MSLQQGLRLLQYSYIMHVLYSNECINLRISKGLLALFLFSLLLFIPGMQQIPALDRDEVHFAQASRQMLQDKQFFQVRFQDTTRFQKPPGINWLQAASVWSFSNADSNQIWPYRLPSCLAALFSILMTYYFVRRFVNQQTALIAAALLASSLLLVVEAHLAVIDASLLLSVVLMQGSLGVVYLAFKQQKNVHWIWPLIFWLAMSIGMVLKGVTPLVGGLSILCLCACEKQVSWLKKLAFWKGFTLFLGLSLLWIFLLNHAEQSNYFAKMLQNDLLPKLQGGHESHGKPPLFHLLLLPLTFWPASLFLFQGLHHGWQKRNEPLIRFLLAWMLPTWLFFEIMPTKLPQYLLPVFPPLAILCALAIEAIRQASDSPKVSRLLKLLQMGWYVLSLGLAAAIIFISYYLVQQGSASSAVLILFISVAALIAVYYAWHAQMKQAVLSICILSVLSYPLIFHTILPAFKPAWINQNLAAVFKPGQLSEQKPLLVTGYDEPGLVFNLNTHLVKFEDSERIRLQLLADKSRFAVLENNLFHHWPQAQEFDVIAQTRGFNYTKGRWIDLVVVRAKQSGELVHVTG